jgi:hypothetical protein
VQARHSILSNASTRKTSVALGLTSLAPLLDTRLFGLG